MMQNKDEEIIKALDCCRNLNGNECEECPYERLIFPMGNGGCTNKLMNDALDMLNRQKAEIAELKSELTITNNNFENVQKLYDESVKIGQKMNQRLMDAYKKLQTAKIDHNSLCETETYMGE